MKALLLARIDQRPYFGFSLYALLAVLALCARWDELTRGLPPWRVGRALSVATAGCDWRRSSKGMMLEAWIAGETVGHFVNRRTFVIAVAKERM